MDVFTKEKRSQIMSHVKQKNTKPELLVRSILYKMGFRFRIHNKKLPGCPDIVLSKWKTVIFVNGCFWHRHADCKLGNSIPKSNTDFWKNKFSKNMKRDLQVYEKLESMGWKVVIIWECQTKNIDGIKQFLFEEIVSSNLDYF